MITSRTRTTIGAILGVILAATAVWLATLLVGDEPPSTATQGPPPAPTTAPTPTETTKAPSFTKEGAIAALRLFVSKRLEAFNTLSEATLRSIYTADCRLANGAPCLKGDLDTLNELKRQNRRLQGYPVEIREITVLSWEPETRTASLRLVYKALPARIINAKGDVVETSPGRNRVVDQVNLVWEGSHWRQAWAGSLGES
jgi:hypothetical protein